MTTTISLATRDCIVIGCDSLGTSSSPMMNPFRVVDQFFEKNGDIKKDANGQPLLTSAAQLSAFVERVPRDQLPNMTKLFHLAPYPVGVTFAGASVMGDYSIRNLVDSFLQEIKTKDLVKANTVDAVASAFYTFVESIYTAAYKSVSDNLKPRSEILLSGYSDDSLLPEVFRLSFGAKCEKTQEVKRGEFNIKYSGQYDVIERVVDGIDLASFISLNERSERVVREYKATAEKWLQSKGITDALPEPDFSIPAMDIFGDRFGGVRGLKANIDALTEQAAINFVEFLVETMIKAQQFSGSIPTVGGDIHIAIITKANGFCWVSKEQYTFRGNTVEKHRKQ